MYSKSKEILLRSRWITTKTGESCSAFVREFETYPDREIKKAVLIITAIGVYEAELNGKRVGDFILAPGVTSYDKRLSYQIYDIASMLSDKNKLSILLGDGWYRGRISENWKEIHDMPGAVRAALVIEYTDGMRQEVFTDEEYKAAGSGILRSDIYDGEVYDANAGEEEYYAVRILPEIAGQELVLQESGCIKEHEHLRIRRILHTPNGETVLDFGQNLAGYVSFCIKARQGERISFSHAEELDAEGNAYRENYRSAKGKITYICKGGEQVYKPHFCFVGFRYAVMEELPAGLTEEDILSGFEAIAIYSEMKRTGRMMSGNSLLNRLYANMIWSQRGNFIDIPTDCPQRDERMGWTGDAQIFCRTAAYNYHVETFFKKWCRDLRAAQRPDGSVPDTVPNFWRLEGSSAAWGDAVCIVPWQMYLAYGSKEILDENFEAMKKWVEYITEDSLERNLWISSDDDKGLWKKHYGDWLALDAPDGSYKGSSRDDFIASAFYLYSVRLVIKAGHVLEKDVTKYEVLEKNIQAAFKKVFHEYHTQTEHVLALFLDLAENPDKTAAALMEDIRRNGNKMKTGFVGTPYLLHVLGKYHYYDLCYDLLLQEEYPSWLFSVKQGATTIWEHWDGRKDDGSFWSADMNSFNHYAYGSVFDWVYGVAAGIMPVESAPGYQEVSISPHPDSRLGFLEVSIETSNGVIRSAWQYEGGTVRYDIEVPVKAYCKIGERSYTLQPGNYVFYNNP